MSSNNSISMEKHARRSGTVKCPVLVDVRTDEDLALSPNLLPGSVRRGYRDVDIEGVLWSHRGELCSFDAMIGDLGPAAPPLMRLATIVRAADTARLDLAPDLIQQGMR